MWLVGGRTGLPPFRVGGGVMGRGGVHAYRKAVVGEKVSDCVAPFGGVGGEGRAAEEAWETGGSGDGLGSHIKVLDFQPCEPPEAVGNLGKERERLRETLLEHLDPAVPEIRPRTGPTAQISHSTVSATSYQRLV